MTTPDQTSIKAPHEAILDLPQERITGDILRGRGPRRGNLERLIRYWRPIMRKPGGFRRCLVILADHPELYPLERICAWLHHETTGLWPNEGNHHAGGKLGKIVKRRVKKPRRKRRGKNYELIPGVDFPIDRLERRLDRKSGSITYAPLDGTDAQIEYKAKNIKRVERAITSVLLPGERGALKPRHLLRTGLTPGGSGAPGPRLQVSPRSPLSRAVAGTGATRGFRCPPGFERGGHFTDSRFSTCGHQLFGVPGSARSGLRTVATAAAQRPTDEDRANAAARQKVGNNTRLRYKADEEPTDGIGGGMPVLPETVGRPDQAKQGEMVSEVLKSMSSVRDVTEQPIRRLVREDGSILQPLAPLEVIGKQKNNPDLNNASLLTRINAPGKFGEEELMLMQTGLRSIEFSLPGGGKVSLIRNGGPMPPGKARAFGKAIAQARREALTDMDFAGLLRETALKTNAVEFTASIPDGGDASRLVRVKGPDGVKRVPLWVYRTFLADDAPGRDEGATTYTMIGGEPEVEAEPEEKSLHDFPHKNWGPLQYTAVLIPDYDAIDHTAGVGYKAAALSGYRKDITERFMEVKRIGSIWDRGINRFRCPPGMSNAGQITNRIGIGCGIPSVPSGGGRGRGLEGIIEAIDGINTPNVGRPGVPVKKPDKPGGRLLAVENRIVDAIQGDAVSGPRLVDKPGRADDPLRARQQRRVGRLKARIANVLDIPVDDNESARLGMLRGADDRRRARVKNRIANAIDAPINTEESELLGRRDRVGVRERIERRRADVKRRIANVFDPVRVRSQREDRPLPTGLKADPSPEMAGPYRAALQDQHINLRAEWNGHMGKGRFADVTPAEAREWLETNAPDLPDEEFRKYEDELLDFEIIDEALLLANGENVAEQVDRLSYNRQGMIKVAADRARAVELQRDQDIEDRRVQRLGQLRADLGVDETVVDDALLGQLNVYQAQRVTAAVRGHRAQAQKARDRIGAGREDKDGIDKLLAGVVRERDRHAAEVARLRNQDSPDPEALAERLAAADIYEEALPEIVGEALRFERLDNLKRTGADDMKALIFNNPDELGKVPTDKMPPIAANDFDHLAIAIGNANSAEELDNLRLDLADAVQQSAEEVARYDEMLRNRNLSTEEIENLAVARGEMAWRGEIAKRMAKPLQQRRKELGGGDDFVNADAKRLDGKLGEYDIAGLPKIKRVEVGNLGISTQAGASKHLKDGGDMKDVPDDFLAEAIRANPGRFDPEEIDVDNVNEVIEYTDRKTGRHFFIKTTDGGPHEPAMEMMANQILAKMGMPVGNMRFGSPTRKVMQEDDYGYANEISLVFEHAGDLFDGRHRDPGRNDRYAGEKITDVKSFVRGWLIDYFSANEDRHPRNWFYNDLPDGKVGFVPIDHGLAWGRFGSMDYPEWMHAMPESDYDIAPDVWAPEDGRIQWVRYLKNKIRSKEFTADEVADEIQAALSDLDEASIGEIISEIKQALPPGYIDELRGVKWDSAVPGIAVPRINRLKSMSRQELLEFLHSL